MLLSLDANLLSDSCPRRSWLPNTLREKWITWSIAQLGLIFLIHSKNGYQILPGTVSKNWMKLKVSKTSFNNLRKKLQTDSRIGTTSLLQRMRNFLLSGRNSIKCHSRSFWSSEYSDQIESLLLLITLLDIIFLREESLLIAIQPPVSLRSCYLHTWIQPPQLQSISFSHLEPIQFKL